MNEVYDIYVIDDEVLSLSDVLNRLSFEDAIHLLDGDITIEALKELIKMKGDKENDKRI